MPKSKSSPKLTANNIIRRTFLQTFLKFETYFVSSIKLKQLNFICKGITIPSTLLQKNTYRCIMMLANIFK
ncbi:hypothetical protein BpHYR1_032388 [Brachionus plicatilis]|uniref:Uncharacterized protein n=1 Tax=Brachionus plicatilis TaxID=10195 RepID=A0A3M7PG81_BRAPC|nr:hypothetical protein BpHYR1_032388 [Brachionus plicatilis]